MPNLSILIPFDPDQRSDLDQGAAELKKSYDSIENHFLGQNIGAEIDGISILYRATKHRCTSNEYLIVFAHGGKAETGLSNNQGQAATMREVTSLLANIGAANSKKILFMCCYSALRGHIADKWKSDFTNQEVYGGDSVISNLFSSTRTQIRAVCAALFQL